MITVLWFVLRFVDFGVAFGVSVGLGVDCWLVLIFICFGVWMGLLGVGVVRYVGFLLIVLFIVIGLLYLYCQF